MEIQIASTRAKAAWKLHSLVVQVISDLVARGIYRRVRFFAFAVVAACFIALFAARMLFLHLRGTGAFFEIRNND